MHPHHSSLGSWCTIMIHYAHDPPSSQCILVCLRFSSLQCTIITVYLLHGPSLSRFTYVGGPSSSRYTSFAMHSPSRCDSLTVHLGLLTVHFLCDQPNILSGFLKMSIMPLRQLCDDAHVWSAKWTSSTLVPKPVPVFLHMCVCLYVYKESCALLHHSNQEERTSSQNTKGKGECLLIYCKTSYV